MSDNTAVAQPTATEDTKIKQPENPVKVSPKRNDIEIEFTEQRTTRGKNPGKIVFEPSCDQDPIIVENGKYILPKFLAWVGMENVSSIVKAKVRGLTLGWADEATDDETGELNTVKFQQFAEEFSARGETIGDLQDQREEIQSELTKLDYGNPDNVQKLLELGRQIQKLTIAINSKKRERKSEDKTAVAA